MPKVVYNLDNFNRCLCGGCPVNRSSVCVQGQEKALSGQFDDIEKSGKMPVPEKEPGIYCAHGKSNCTDQNRKRSCLCPACPVEITDDLCNNYYCLKGSAEEIG